MSRAFIIDPTISAIDGLYDLLGIGIPNQGGILYSSLEYFEKALEELAAAFPGDGWLGSAADKYAGKNRNHVNFFQELADLDRQLISLIHDQANAVQTTRDILEGAKKGLEFVRPVAVDLTYIPVVGHALSAAIADIISDVADIIKGILGEVWEFITNALNGLKELWDKLTGWVTGLFSRGWSNLESFFAGVPGLTGATSGLSQVTGLFGAAGLSASSGLAHADSLASSASLPALAGIGGGSGFGGLPSLAQVHAASTRQALRPRADGPVGAAAEQVGGQSQLVSAQGSQGMGGPVGMGGMHPSSGASKGTTTKKYSEGAAAGTEDAERAPVEADAGGGQKVLVRNVV